VRGLLWIHSDGIEAVLIIDEVLVDALSQKNAVVSWSFRPTVELLGNYRVTVSRSLSPLDDFEPIATGLRADQFVYLDQDPPEMSKWTTLYYKVTVEKVDATGAVIPGETHESDAFRIHQEYSPRAMMIIRSRMIYFSQLEIGRDSLVYRRRTSGQTCPECYDPVQQRTTRQGCPVCFGTGRVGGYYPPIRVMIQYQPGQRRNTIMSHLTEEVRIQATMGHFPLMTPRDIIYEIGTQKWYVVNTVTPKEDLRVVTSQKLDLRELDAQAKEQDLPIPDSEQVAGAVHRLQVIS